MESGHVIQSFLESDNYQKSSLKTAEQPSVQSPAETLGEVDCLLVIQQPHYIFHAVVDRSAVVAILDVPFNL